MEINIDVRKDRKEDIYMGTHTEYTFEETVDYLRKRSVCGSFIFLSHEDFYILSD